MKKSNQYIAGIKIKRGRTIASITTLIILIIFTFSSFALLTGRIKYKAPKASAGFMDLTDFDFNNTLANISHTSFIYYKDELYTSLDFKLGRVNKEPISLNNVDGRFDPGNFGTYRIILDLPQNQTYGLSSYSAMYSQRLFINGKEYTAFGSPGKTAETTIPETKHYTFFFTPENVKTEIIIQFANYDHYDYGGIVPLYLGIQDKIIERDAIAQQRIHILVGCIVTAFLFFIGLFFFFHWRGAFLWFSLACLSIGIRMLIVQEKVIMLLFPELSWNFSIGLEYISLILLMFAFLMYIYSMFQGAIHRIVLLGFGTICLLFTTAVVLTPPIFYTRFMLWFQICSVFFGIYIVIALIYNIVRKQNNRHMEHILILIGAFVFIVLSIMDIQIHRSSGYSYALGLAEAGMMAMIIVNMIALTVQFSRNETELYIARQSEHEMQETNQLLDRMSRLKSDFLENISHEMRTPLTVIASYAGLTSRQIRRNAIDSKSLENLDIIKREAIRLAELVEQLKEVSLEKERQNSLEDVSAMSLLQQVVDFCKPICRKNKNVLSFQNDNEDTYLRVNPNKIFQTLINLIINANRHTKEGSIGLCIESNYSEENSDFVTIKVFDNGEGIDQKLLPELFKRGVSGVGSSGLGLSICKEIIDEHGGKIWIESEKGKGTIIRLTLPRKKGNVQQ